MGSTPVLTSNKYITRDELAKQLSEETRARQNAEKRESYWKDKFYTQCLEMEKDDHEDLSKMFLNAPNVPEEMSHLWEQQKKLLQTKSKNSYRWHKK